jgi:hypothetical protein
MSELEAKIIKEGEAAHKAYKEFYEWCDEASANLNNEIKNGKKEEEKLEAKIAELSSDIEVCDTKIEELAADIASNEKELKDATTIREKEAADFALSEKELEETVDTLDRAISIISTEMAKNPAALAQIDTSSMTTLLQSLSTVVDAAGFVSSDKKKLLALVQAQQEDQDEDVGAPAATVYKSHSGDIVGLLEDLKEKAETELSEARKAESNSKHNYQMMKQSLEDQMANENKDLNAQKTAKDAAAEEKSTSEGDLAVTVKDVKADGEALATANSDCMQTAGDYEATVAARNEELKVIATAEKILKESTSGAVSQTYSLLQLASASKLQTRSDLAGREVVSMVQKLAKAHHSAALAQLASRIAVVLKYKSSGGNDPFAKVKGLITEMLAKLEAEGEAEATEKAYCDEQMSKTEAKKADLESVIAKLSSKIDKRAARSAELKNQVKELQAELAELAKSQAEMDSIRAEEHSNFVTAKKELEEGLTGVRKALGVLREYYGNSAALLQDGDDQPAKPKPFAKAEGAGGSIIDILEVCESDFASNLAKEETEEADSEEEYQKQTQANKVTTTEKDQDVKYKNQEATALDKAIAELSSDRDTTNNELAAVNEYYGKVRERCVAKPESYEERRAHREAEINGLKEALNILETETASFVQRKRASASLTASWCTKGVYARAQDGRIGQQ